jgi:hypothetical protein
MLLKSVLQITVDAANTNLQTGEESCRYDLVRMLPATFTL